MSFTLPQQLRKVVLALCEDIATPMSASVKEMVIGRRWVELQQLNISPLSYDDAFSYWKDKVVVDLLRKCDLPTGIDKREAAVKTFLLCEKQCAMTNVRLQSYLPDTFFIEDPRDSAVSEFIGDWRKDIANVLGMLPRDLTCRFGKGSTFGDKGQLITVPDKMSSQPSITEGASCLKPFWHETSWYSSLAGHSPALSEPEVVRGNRFSTVPKTGLTDRGICIEPSLNVSFQLDVGRVLKAKLKAIGIDLKNGQQVHQDRAQAASFLDTDSTIDMSNASDTVCRVLPRLVLPNLWWELLDSLRCPFTLLNGSWYRLEKFSSMGNGFTFELESLLYSTLAKLIVRKEGGDPDRVLCYGDDLIVPKSNTRSVLNALKYFGFTPNVKKTFTDGPFRESCGGDFFKGVPVRAHNLENLPTEPQHWISLANGLWRLGHSDPNNPRRMHLVRRAWHGCLDAIPSHIRRCRGPIHLGDIVIHDDEQYWNVVRGGNFPKIRAYTPIPSVLQWNHWKPATQLACCTLGYGSEGISPRGGVSGFRIKKVPLWGTDFLPRPMDYQSHP